MSHLSSTMLVDRWSWRPAFPGAVALLVLFATGCGMGDYLGRMEAQQRRIQEFDEINRLLDDPIEIPMVQPVGWKESLPAWSWNRTPTEVYFRLPRGFSTTPKDKEPYTEFFPFFRYSDDSGYSIFVVVALLAEPDKKDEYGKYHSRRFRTMVKDALDDYYVKTNKLRLPWPAKIESRVESVKRFTPYPDDAKSLIYQTFEFHDLANPKVQEHSLFRVYFHEDSGKQLCVVTKHPIRQGGEEADKAFRKAFTASLRTLDLGGEAATRRAQFRKAKTN